VVRRHPVRTAIIVFAAALIGAGVWLWARPPDLPATASPETVARTYFELDAAGRFLAATHFVWHAGRSEAPHGQGYGGARITSIDNAVPIPNEGYGSRYDSLAQLCGVTVNYHSKANGVTDPPGDSPGDYCAFALLGREAPTSPWRLLEFGGSGL
jgi:hypothetical protein